VNVFDHEHGGVGDAGSQELHDGEGQPVAAEPFAEPHQIPAAIDLVDVSAEELAAADAVVVLTDHDQFDYGLVQRTASYVFDARNRCRGRQVERI